MYFAVSRVASLDELHVRRRTMSQNTPTEFGFVQLFTA